MNGEEAGVPTCLTGAITKLPDIDFCMDGATHLIHNPKGPTRLKATNDESRRLLEDYTEAKVVVTVCGYWGRGPECTYLGVFSVTLGDSASVKGKSSSASRGGQQRCELAEVSDKSLKVLRFMDVHFVVASGYRDSTLQTPRIRQLPMEIFPPELVVELCGDPGPLKPQPFFVAEQFRWAKGIEKLNIHTASGIHEVEVQELPLFSTGPWLGHALDESKSNDEDDIERVVGVSENLSFDEAYRDALKKLLKLRPSGSDRLLEAEVTKIRSSHGSIADLSHLWLEVKGKWT